MASKNQAITVIAVTLILTLAAIMVVFTIVPSRATVAADAAAAAAGSTVTATVTVRSVQTVTGPTVTAPPPGPAVAFTDGTYRVGAQVEPGTYQASDPNPPATLCYWEKLSDTGELIDNGANEGLMFIASDDYAVRVQSCGDWSRVG
jgi:hypothetical protein